MPQTAAATDEVLVRRARDGDQRAFRTLVERYEGAVAATVVGMLGRGADADDVGQETFIRFYNALGRFRGDASVKTYLTRIAINQSLRAIKKRQRWSARFFSRDDDRVSEAVDAVPANDEIGDAERVEMIRQALQTLPPPNRSVVVLRMMEGFDTKETGAILGIPQGTVMSRLARGLEKLEKVIGPLR